MKRSRFTEDQIIGILKEHEAGVSVADLCRKHGVSDATVYKWKARSHLINHLARILVFSAHPEYEDARPRDTNTSWLCHHDLRVVLPH